MMQKTLRKILFVDDDDDILSIIKYSLDSVKDVIVYTANTGQKGIEIALKESLDLIVLDVMMPVMDGLSVFSVLRLLPYCKTVPIVFLTAKAQKSEIEQFLVLGAAGVIVKPFDPISLMEDLLKLWEKSQK